jgi:glycosyltransferase involved in cell wall biosynthesis
MRIVHIVDNILPVNIGIWKAAINTSAYLQEQLVSSILIHPNGQGEKVDGIIGKPTDTSLKQLQTLIDEGFFDKKNDIIVTHGCWQFPTKWGEYLKKQGFVWIYTPHGMLEPWSMQQKRFKKQVYFSMVEKKAINKADVIRAVGKPEMDNLNRLFPYKKVVLIPNGVKLAKVLQFPQSGETNFLFMARLHHKKGLLPLINAWLTSSLHNKPGYNLYIAGPDDGEMSNMETLLQNAGSINIHYIGILNEQTKQVYFSKCLYYILPSFSEGFPTSVVEAMAAGLVPVITDGCNFPEAFENGYAVKITTNVNSITNFLDQLKQLSTNEWEEKRKNISEWVNKHYSLNTIASRQYALYKDLLITNN